MKLGIKKKHHKITEFIVPLDDRQAVLNLRKSLRLRSACLSETMGPFWKDLFWINGKPNVKKHPWE